MTFLSSTDDISTLSVCKFSLHPSADDMWTHEVEAPDKKKYGGGVKHNCLWDILYLS